MKRRVTLAIAGFIVLAVAVAAKPRPNPPAYINGQVVRVIDGDTLTVAENGVKHKIRLYGIDCPECERKGRWKAQPGSADATGFVKDFTVERDVTVVVRERDWFGRIVGEVLVDGRSLNRELVRAGRAWHYRKYTAKDLDLERLEAKARIDKRGLWKCEPTPPWKYRRMKVMATITDSRSTPGPPR